MSPAFRAGRTIGMGGQLVALVFLAACETSPKKETPKDRFGLGAQPQVYVVHQTAQKPFQIERKDTIGSGARSRPVMMQHFESARLQQRLDLEDPVVYLKDRLTEVLRDKLALTNARIETEALNMPIIAGQAEEPMEEEQTPVPEGSPQRLSTPAARNAKAFNDTHPYGAVIEVLTTHWGMHDYRMKYSARVRVFDTAKGRRLTQTSCGWVMFDQVDRKELPPPTGYDKSGNYNPNVRDEYADAMEARLYADNGALLKASLRKAAEICADRVIGRFLGSAKGQD